MSDSERSQHGEEEQSSRLPASAGSGGPPPTSPARATLSYDEFSPLREVIIGNAAKARIPPPSDPSVWLTVFGDLDAREVSRVKSGALPSHIIEETAEDLDGLREKLQGLGVVVYQGADVDHDREFATPHWQAEGFYSYCPRDLTLIVGTTIIETPSPMRGRYFELFGLADLFQGYLRHGSAWISAPKPRLRDDLYSIGDDGYPLLGEDEPAFDAANVLRCGRDLFYLVSSTANEMGFRWLENTLRAIGEFRVHPLRGMYRHAHIDSTIVFLRPGLVLLNPARVNDSNLPDVFRKWDIIWCPPMEHGEQVPEHPMGSAWIGMNLLMVAPDVAIVDSSQVALSRVLEDHNISVVPHTLRHARRLGGGMHCVTLDTVREGELESYFG